MGNLVFASDATLVEKAPQAVAYAYLAPENVKRALAYRYAILVEELGFDARNVVKATPLHKNLSMVRRFVRHTLEDASLEVAV